MALKRWTKRGDASAAAFSFLPRTYVTEVRPWRTMEPPLQHIHCRIFPLESDDKLPNMSSCIQDTTYFAVFLADDSGGKSSRVCLQTAANKNRRR